MKNLKISLVYTIVGILMAVFISCQTVNMQLLKVTGHIKTPKPETPETILKYAKEKNFYYDYLFMPVDDDAILEIIQKDYFMLGGILPFDNQKRPIIVNPQKGGEECPHYTAYNFQSQDTTIAFAVSDTLEFWDRLSLMQLIDKREELPNLSYSTPIFDYFVIGMWCPMLPKASKNVHLDFLDAIAIDTTKRVCVISFNYSPRAGNNFYKSLNKQVKQAKKEYKKESKRVLKFS